MKKKLLSIMMAAAMVISLAACGSDSGSESDAGTDKTETEEGNEEASGEVYSIGICQLVQHDALDAATQGFKDALTELCGEDGVKFDEQNAQGEHNMCATIINQFVSDLHHLIQTD